MYKRQVVGTYFFKFPNNFAFGGVTGFATIVNALTPLSAGDFTFVANMVLLIIGFLFLGKNAGIMTVYSSVLMSVALSGMERIWPMAGPLTEEPLLELVFAVFLSGVGSSLLFNIGASSGGYVYKRQALFGQSERFCGQHRRGDKRRGYDGPAQGKRAARRRVSERSQSCPGVD